MTSKELLAYAVAYTGRGDDCGRLARMVVETLPSIQPIGGPALPMKLQQKAGHFRPVPTGIYTRTYTSRAGQSLCPCAARHSR